MLNQVVLVGRVSKELEEGVFEISVQRNFKNEKGKYDIDFIQINVTKELEESCKSFLKKSMMVAVKSRIETERKTNKTKIVLEKLSFLSGGEKDGE